jgi:membrane fusion protein (multidrug efflux system)
VGYSYWRYASTHVSTDDAYLTTDVVQITPQVSGSVAKVYVTDNQHVQAGQLLVVLDDSTYRAAVEQAKANLKAAIAAAQGANTGVDLTQQTTLAQISQAEAGVTQAQAGVETASADVSRAEAAYAAAQTGVQTALQAAKTAQAGVVAAQAAYQKALQGVQAARQKLADAEAALQSAKANVIAAQAKAKQAATDAKRYDQLYQEDAVSAQTRDAADTAAIAAQAALESAQQAVSQAQALVGEQQAALNSAQQEVTTAQANLKQARAQYAAALYGIKAAKDNAKQAQAQYLAAQKDVNAARARVQQAEAQLQQAETAPAQVAVQKSNAHTAAARIAQATAALHEAEIHLQDTRIYAPVTGRVNAKTVEIGEQVAPGQALMAMVPDKDIWVVANFKETQITNMKPGQPAEIHVDAFPGITYHGHVDSLASGTGAVFTLLPPDNATGNFTKVVQRVPVKIVFDPKQPGLDRLRAGLSVEVSVKVK